MLFSQSFANMAPVQAVPEALPAAMALPAPPHRSDSNRPAPQAAGWRGMVVPTDMTATGNGQQTTAGRQVEQAWLGNGGAQ
jgi:hypothetical protein